MQIPHEVESRIADAPVSAHVATSVDDRPHVAPVWYGYRDGSIYFFTGGKKLTNVRQNPRVALSIEDARGADVEWNVTLLGTATVHDDSEKQEWAEEWIYDRYDDEDENPSTDGGTDAEGGTDADGANGADGETETDADQDDDADAYSLVEVTVRSAAWNIY